jgi:hypothetical protein
MGLNWRQARFAPFTFKLCYNKKKWRKPSLTPILGRQSFSYIDFPVSPLFANILYPVQITLDYEIKNAGKFCREIL